MIESCNVPTSFCILWFNLSEITLFCFVQKKLEVEAKKKEKEEALQLFKPVIVQKISAG